MSYQLREDLHYCYAGRQIVFMDLRNDAYFLLAGPLERAFLAYVAGQRVTKEELNHLLGRGLLIEADGTSPRTAGKSVPLPTRSITEQGLLSRSTTIGLIIEVAGLVYATRRRLRNCSIRKVLAEHLEQCRVSGGAAEVEAIFTDETDIAEAAHQYRSARRYAPVDTSCLLDSLAMHRFLANRGLASAIVFGVNAEPFSAHAWLQAGNLALNESVSYARMHTPILVL